MAIKHEMGETLNTKSEIQNVRKTEEKKTSSNIIRLAEGGYEEVNTIKLVYGVE
jgi:hypothetical protein